MAKAATKPVTKTENSPVPFVTGFTVVTLLFMVAATVVTPESDPGPHATVDALVSEGLQAFRRDPAYVIRMAEAAASLRKRRTSRRSAA